MEKLAYGSMPPEFMQKLHIGKMIETELRSQKRTVTWLSRQLHCDRRNVYDIFSRTSLDTSLLMRVSVILHYDFFKALSDLYYDTCGDTYSHTV